MRRAPRVLRTRDRGLTARATLLAIALLLPFAVATHFVGELGALGFERDLPVAFGPHHVYLALVLFASLAGAVGIVRAELRRSGSQAVARLVAALPFRGEGPGFFALCVGVQSLFFVTTQQIEGSPVHAGDVVLGLLAAGTTAVLSSLAVGRVKRELLRFAVRLCGAWFVARRTRVVWFALAVRPARTARRRWAVLASRANRPPPALRPAV